MDLFFFESEIKMPVMKLPLRSTLIKTDQARILISPVHFTSEQIGEIQSQGEVTDLVAPSVLHHLYMKKASQHFPKAKLWGMPGLLEKCPDIKWDCILTRDPWPYQNDIEMIPIEGVPRMAEVALYCQSLKTLIVTDLCFNLQSPQGLGSVLMTKMLGTYGKFAVSRLLGQFMKDRNAFQRSMQNILKRDFEQVVMAHGEVLARGGRKHLEDALKEKKYLSSKSE